MQGVLSSEYWIPHAMHRLLSAPATSVPPSSDLTEGVEGKRFNLTNFEKQCFEWILLGKWQTVNKHIVVDKFGFTNYNPVAICLVFKTVVWT